MDPITMGKYDEYESPLAGRYGSTFTDHMMSIRPAIYFVLGSWVWADTGTRQGDEKIFSPRERATTWRKLWLWLAEVEKELGLTKITDEAVEAIRSNLFVSDEAFQIIAEEERIRRHDVMSHIFTLEQEAPAARGLIRWGATSCFVTDNAGLIFIRDSLDLLLPKLAKVIHNLSQFALEYKNLPALAYTHLQAAQPLTVGKRARQWIIELLMDLEDIEYVRAGLRFPGAQGTTGTQASLMEIFHNDTSKIDRLNELLCEKAGFKACYDISMQTYTRKVDLRVAHALSGFGASAMRIAAV
jgi:adenylosuccinate lyase